MSIIQCILLLAAGVCATNKWAPGDAAPTNRASETGLPARLEINARLRIAATGAKDDCSYRVDEYIDKPNSRVTIRLQNQSTGQYTTYYRLGDPHQMDTITQFDETKQECHIVKLSSQWSLQKLSKLVSLLPGEYQINDDESNSKSKSTVIGTGSILYIVMNKLNKKLTFEGRTFDNERFTHLNYFSTLFDLSGDQKKKNGLNLNGHDGLALRVTVGMPLSVSKSAPQSGDSWELATSNVMTQLDRVPYTVVMDIVNRGATSDDANGQDGEKDKPISRSVYAVLIDYYMARPLVNNNNMLTEADEGPQLDGHRFTEPFILPLGLWCWVGYESSVYSLELDHDQFSGVYYDELASSQTANDMFYMAYDGKTKTLRYDTPGRKTILDLKQNWAYHLSKNTQPAEPQVADPQQLGEPENCFQPPIGIDILQVDQQQQEPCKQQLATDSKCSLIEMDTETVSSKYKDLARILGLSSMDRMYLMGQADIDGLNCHVYERLVIPEQLPKIFGFRPIEAQLVYFLIVYVVHDNSLLDDELSLKYNTMTSWPKRLVLLSFNTSTKRRQLEASVMFTQFSWTLQVGPNEADSGVSGPVRSVHLFDVDQCAPIRRGRARLEFFVEQQGDTLYSSSKSDFLVDSRWKTLTTTAQASLQQWIMGHISDSYGISRARVTNLELTFRRQAVLVRAILLELPDVHSEIKPLGYFADCYYPAEKLAELASKWQNTRITYWISLDECHLEGAVSGAHTITYCPNYNGMCIVVAHTDMPLLSSSRFNRGSTADRSFCSVYTVQQVSTQSKLPNNSLRQLIDDSQRLLTARPISGKLKLLWDGPNKTMNRKLTEFKFVARVKSVKIGLMESIREVEALSGLNFMVSRQVSGDPIDNSTMSGHLNEQVSATNYYVTNISRTDDDYPVGLIYCHEACQLSDHCHSWSFCRTKSTQSWCTLTDLELTQAVLLDLSRLKTAAERKLPVTYSPQQFDEKRVYYLESNDQCSLHSKDYYQLYEESTGNNSVQLQPDQLKQFAFVSLEECARLCFTHELPYDEKNNYNGAYQVCENFNYCPVISLCHFDGLSGSDLNFFSQQTNKDPMTLFRGRNLEQQFNLRQQCHRYHRNYLQYFQKLLFLRLTLTDTSSAKEISSSSDVITKFANLNFNQCIRHCALADDRCLAFDYCRASMSSTCLIYTIKSPGAALNGDSPDYSPEVIEQYPYFSQQTTEANKPAVKYKVALRSDERCDHHFLIDTYANVKLSLSKHKYFSDSMILEQDQYISNSIERSDLFTNGTAITSNKINNDMNTSNHSLVNFATFAIGLAMGVLIYLMVPSYVVRRVKRRQETEHIRFKVFSSVPNEHRQHCSR